MEQWLIRLLNGVTFGGLLFLLASGFTLSLGVMRVVNIAHGAFYLLAAYIAWSVFQDTGNIFLSTAVASVSIAVVALAMHQLLLRKLHLQPLRQILVTVGVALIIAEMGVIYWGGRPRVMGQPDWLSGATDLGAVSFPTYRLFIVAVAVVVGLLLWVMLRMTRIGALIRASVDDEEMVRGMGVSVPTLHAFIFGLTGLLAGLGGGLGAAFLGAYQGAEFDILLLSVVVVVLGGLGSLAGAALGSLIIGLLDSFGRSLFPEFAHFTLFAPMILILIVRPAGLMGRPAGLMGRG